MTSSRTRKNDTRRRRAETFPRSLLHSHAAFTLIELLVVMSIIGILLAFTIPAMTGLTGSTSLNTATRQVSNLLTVARTEAIAQNTVTRFAVATDWPGDDDASHRKFCIWAWNRALHDYEIISDWESLPTGIIMEPALPDYMNDSSYATKDITTVKCDYFLEVDDPKFEREFRDGLITMRFIEFRPTGAARIKDGKYRNIALVLTEGFGIGTGTAMSVSYTSPGDAGPKNWAQINADTLTGRIRIYRP